MPGWFGSVGFDFQRGSGTAVGVQADYHYLWPERAEAPSFSAVTLGTHVLFGR